MTAIRETFEETGLLLARSRLSPVSAESSAPLRLDQDALNRARQSILLGRAGFSKFLEDAGLTPAVDELLPLTEWITPVQVPRCGLWVFAFGVCAEGTVSQAVPRPVLCRVLAGLIALWLFPRIQAGFHPHS